MSHLRRFVSQPEMSDSDLQLLARQVAMDLVERDELCTHLSLTAAELARIEADPSFAERVKAERRRLLSLEGQRDMAEWKQALTEHKFWDRLMTMALAETTSPTAVIDAMKVVKRPAAKDGGAGGGGPAFVVNISVPGEAPMRVAASVVDSEATEA